MTVLDILDALVNEIDAMTLPAPVVAQTTLLPRYRLEELSGPALATVTPQEITLNPSHRGGHDPRYRVAISIQRKLQGPNDVIQDDMRESLEIAEAIAQALYQKPLATLPRAICREASVSDIAIDDLTPQTLVFMATIAAEYQIT